MPAQFDSDALCVIQLGLHTRDIDQSLRYFTLQVTNAVELAKECQEAGYEVVHPGGDFVPDGPGPQCTFSMVRDPDGNLIEFAQGSPWAEPIYEFPKFS